MGIVLCPETYLEVGFLCQVHMRRVGPVRLVTGRENVQGEALASSGLGSVATDGPGRLNSRMSMSLQPRGAGQRVGLHLSSWQVKSTVHG